MTAGTGFQVQPVRLRSAAPQFDAAADRLEDTGNALRAALAADAPGWGGDAAGQTFARSYLPDAEATSTALGILVQALRGIRAGLDASADTWEGCDLSTAARLGGPSASGKQPSAEQSRGGQR